MSPASNLRTRFKESFLPSTSRPLPLEGQHQLLTEEEQEQIIHEIRRNHTSNLLYMTWYQLTFSTILIPIYFYLLMQTAMNGISKANTSTADTDMRFPVLTRIHSYLTWQLSNLALLATLIGLNLDFSSISSSTLNTDPQDPETPIARENAPWLHKKTNELVLRVKALGVYKALKMRGMLSRPFLEKVRMFYLLYLIVSVLAVSWVNYKTAAVSQKQQQYWVSMDILFSFLQVPNLALLASEYTAFSLFDGDDLISGLENSKYHLKSA